MFRILACIAGLAMAFTLAPSAAMAQQFAFTISTNNTPLDSAALEALSKEVLRRMGRELEIVRLPSERSLVSANLGEVDGEGLRIAGLSQKYPNLVQIPEKYIAIQFVAFARDKTIVLDKGWDSLRPYRVAFIHGWKMFEANAMGARIVNKVDEPEQMLRMLENGRIDLALYTLADGQALVRKMGLTGIVPLSPPLRDVDMYLYLHKKHEPLVAQWTQTLRQLKADGSYDRILSSVQRP
ncbi:substrate-binding periplasmic protein [Candidatus Symbiobacter mobilis]|nr:transporter substrate-binding domain-containing protein [Candidatus Symbiobacter mobilis]